MSQQNIKVGLLGAGYILQAHAKAVGELAHARVHAICDLSRARAQQAADQYGAANVYTRIDELAGSDCDAVHVLLPPNLHASAAARLLDGGKHVFLEKPMAIGAAECRELVDLAAVRGLRLGVNHNFLFVPAYEELRRRLESGELGRIDHLSVNWLSGLGLLQAGPFDNWMLSSPWNLLYEVGPHVAAFVIDLLGPPDSLRAMISRPLDLPGEQRVYRHWNAIASANGASISVNLSLAPGQADRSMHVRGYGAAADLDFARNMLVVKKSTSVNPILDDFHMARSAGSQVLRQGWRNVRGYVAQTLRATARGNPFEQSIAASIAAFHAPGQGPLDRRIDGAFGLEVIRLLDRIAKDSGALRESRPRAVRELAAEVAGAEAASPSSAGAASRGMALVIGGTGFIGKRLVRALLDAGYRVRVMSRSRSSARVELNDPGVEIVEGSHGDAGALDQALRGVDVVFHLAKATGKKWDDYVNNDVEPTRLLGEAALRHGIKRFVYTGTIDSYYSARPSDVIDGSTGVDPQIESRNHYARSKAACEALLTRMHREQGLPLVIFRPGIVIGEGSPPAHWGVGMFYSDTRMAYWGDGQNKIPLVLVDDVADALVRGASTPGIEGQSFLLTSPPVMTAREYVDEVSRLSGSRVDARPHPIWRFYATDLLKESLKHLIRHPNRRKPSLRDWNCRAHRARYDSSHTMKVLGWNPAATREEIVDRGVRPSVVHHMR